MLWIDIGSDCARVGAVEFMPAVMAGLAARHFLIKRPPGLAVLGRELREALDSGFDMASDRKRPFVGIDLCQFGSGVISSSPCAARSSSCGPGLSLATR
jgi:hypothetical protein